MGQVSLSEKEINLLKLFLNNENIILSRSDILEEVWGMDSDPTPRTIDNFILKFRKLFELNATIPHHFITIRNKGYLFKA
jgi:DNA-binding response OmpR family regulator